MRRHSLTLRAIFQMQKAMQYAAIATLGLGLTGCVGDGEPPVRDEWILPTHEALVSVRAVDPANLQVTVVFNSAAPIYSAVRSDGGDWRVPGIPRSGLLGLSNTVVIRWEESHQGIDLLLAEYNGRFDVFESSTQIDPRGSYITSGAARFDNDLDGVSNLAERGAEPATDPLTAFSFPVPAMVDLPPGCFDMGSPPTEPARDPAEGPQRNVCINTSYIGQHEVTFAQYDAFAAATGRALPDDAGWGRGNLPVINVSRQEATAYAAWLSSQTGQPYRLPTEAEWEYAARAGSTTPFHTGATITTEQANYDGSFSYNGSATGVYRQQTTAIGAFAANTFGLHDVHGNVWEWTCSAYANPYNGAEQRCENVANHALRGGSWFNPPVAARSASRGEQVSIGQINNIGFRLVRD